MAGRPDKETNARDYGTVGKKVPCWDRECSGTIVIHRDPTRCVCNVCRRRLPNAEGIKKSLALIAFLLVLVVGFFIFVVFRIARLR